MQSSTTFINLSPHEIPSAIINLKQMNFIEAQKMSDTQIKIVEERLNIAIDFKNLKYSKLPGKLQSSLSLSNEDSFFGY